MEDFIIREIKANEISILEDMLYQAVFQPENGPFIPKDIIKAPEINAYIKDFRQKKDDYCLVAEIKEKIVGAVWIRILSGEIKGFGNINKETPEFAISLFKEFRNKGLGTMLMQKMIDYLKDRNYKQASLSVNKENYAVCMYQKLGFIIDKENKDDYLMLLKLKE